MPALRIAAACLAIAISLRYWALFRQESLNGRKLGHAICTNSALCILQSCFIVLQPTAKSGHCSSVFAGCEAALMTRSKMQGFQEALKEHEEQLVKDPVVHTHLSALYDTLLEQNLIRLIEPFSCVQIQHVAELIKLPLDTVLNKLAQVLYPKLCCIA